MAACSKPCAGKLRGGEFHRKSDLEKKVVDAVKAAGKYLTKEQIMDALLISSKTLTAYGVSTLACNKTAGFNRPARYFENLVFEILSKRFKVMREVSFDGCVSPKGALLRFDYFVEDEGLLIEADGSQHKAGHPWHRDYHSVCDATKQEYAKANGLRLVRIPYTKRLTPQYLFNALETKTATT